MNLGEVEKMAQAMIDSEKKSAAASASGSAAAGSTDAPTAKSGSTGGRGFGKSKEIDPGNILQ